MPEEISARRAEALAWARKASCSPEAAPEASFGHREHVKLAWLRLRDLGAWTRALEEIARDLRELSAHHNDPGCYHETITGAFVVEINQRMKRLDDGHAWEEFARRNADLLASPRDFLLSRYERQTLESDFAKRVFVLPDKR